MLLTTLKHHVDLYIYFISSTVFVLACMSLSVCLCPSVCICVCVLLADSHCLTFLWCGMRKAAEIRKLVTMTGHLKRCSSPRTVVKTLRFFQIEFSFSLSFLFTLKGLLFLQLYLTDIKEPCCFLSWPFTLKKYQLKIEPDQLLWCQELIRTQ